MMKWRDRILNLEGSLDSVVRPKTDEEQFATTGPIKFVYKLIGKTILRTEFIGQI